MMWRWQSLALFALGGLAFAGPADETKKPAGKTDPPGVPLEAVLKAKLDTYTLDLGGKTAAEFRKQIESGGETGNYPEAPKVDLVLELKNTGSEAVQVQAFGTENTVELKLNGPGAITEPLKRRITNKLRIAPKAITLEPGKSVSVPITSLMFGFKGSHRAWWVEPGKYTLSASYKTSVSPRPKDARDAGGGFGAVTVTSAPVPLKVEAK